jgi:hypothetical protein
MSPRRSIILPSGVTIQGVVSAGGVQLYEDQIQSMLVDTSNNVQIVAKYGNENNATLFTVGTTSRKSAFDYLSQIQNFLNSDSWGRFFPIIYEAPLTFSSVAPNAVSAASTTPTQYTVYGTGFYLSGINGFKLDDGAGDTGGMWAGLVNDGVFTPEPTVIPNHVPGVYTLYYTTDFGATWTTTGLTITAS